MTHARGDDVGDETALLQARVAALRSDGAWRIDPPRFHFLESLLRRLGEQPPAVRKLLEAKLRAALADYTARVAPPHDHRFAPKPATGSSADAGSAPLAALNRYIREASLASRTGEASLDETPLPDELASARRFQQAWASRRTQDQVAQAAARKPLNAGPLNSHGLVLQSLALMEELSPHYLQRFVMHVETLQWLAAAADKSSQAKARPAAAARRGRSRK